MDANRKNHDRRKSLRRPGRQDWLDPGESGQDQAHRPEQLRGADIPDKTGVEVREQGQQADDFLDRHNGVYETDEDKDNRQKYLDDPESYMHWSQRLSQEVQ